MKTKITVTGADDSVSPRDLLKLHERFPEVEFGILLSRNSQGSRRFPSTLWLTELTSQEFDTIPIAGHVCGAWVREILQGKWPIEEFKQMLGKKFFERFGRWQLNTHGIRHKWNQAFLDSLDSLIPGEGPRQVIFQYDKKHNDLIEAAIRAGHTNIAALFDLSHGTGAVPNSWPPILKDISCGYAGGLSPENVFEQCTKIQEVVGDAEIWIDAETHLRSKDGMVFCLHKVEEFITKALPFTRIGY